MAEKNNIKVVSVAIWTPTKNLVEFQDGVVEDLVSTFPKKSVKRWGSQCSYRAVYLNDLVNSKNESAKLVFLIDNNFKPYALTEKQRKTTPLPTYIMFSTEQLEAYVRQMDRALYNSVDNPADEYAFARVPSLSPSNGVLDFDTESNIGVLTQSILEVENLKLRE